MPLRRKDNPAPAPAQQYSLEKVREMLDTIGISRLRVRDPKLKVLLTLIAQNGEPYLTATSPGGTPTDVGIITFQNLLESLIRVIDQYIEIQSNPGRYPNSDTLLKNGYEAADGFARQVLKMDTPGGTQSMTDYTVDTKILTAQQFR